MKLFWYKEKSCNFTITKKLIMLSKSAKNNAGNPSKVKISKDVKSYCNDPFVIQKGKESKEFLDKYGFPKELLKK